MYNCNLNIPLTIVTKKFRFEVQLDANAPSPNI